ncbi:MAG: hypothetical protein QW568_02805 [Candidatus Anstonellaceae archaeon]
MIRVNSIMDMKKADNGWNVTTKDYFGTVIFKSVGVNRGNRLFYKMLTRDVQVYENKKAFAVTLEEKAAVRAELKNKYSGREELVRAAMRQAATRSFSRFVAIFAASLLSAGALMAPRKPPELIQHALDFVAQLFDKTAKGQTAQVIGTLIVGTSISLFSIVTFIYGLLKSNSRAIRIANALKDVGITLPHKESESLS